MRYYSLQIFQTGSTPPPYTFTSHPDGPSGPMDPGALKIECNAIVAPMGIPYGGSNPGGGGDYGSSWIRVWGIPLQLIGQAYNLSAPTGTATPTWSAILTGGMAQGLPLANPSQIGVLIQGTIFRAIGNWIGTDMTLDLYLAPGPVTQVQNFQAAGWPNQPSNNFTFHWPAGQPIANAIKATLGTAYPDVPLKISVNPQLVLDRDVNGTYTTIQQFAQFLNEKSNAMLGVGNAQYTGIQTWFQGGTLSLSDFSQQGPGQSSQATGGTPGVTQKTTTINIQDLVGQPTWVASNTIQVTTVARGDIAMGDQITLPPTLTAVTQAGALANTLPLGQNRFGLSFNGTITVQSVHHTLNYKSPQGQAWVTIFDCIVNPGPMTPATPPPTSSPASTPAPLAAYPSVAALNVGQP